MLINSFNQNPYNNKPQQQPGFGLSPEYLLEKANKAYKASKTANPYKFAKHLRQNNNLIDGAMLRDEKRNTGATFQQARAVIEERHAQEKAKLEKAKAENEQFVQKARVKNIKAKGTQQQERQTRTLAMA